MIPLTDQVETVAFLMPSSPPAPRILFEDDDVFVTEKAAHEEPLAPTTAELVWSAAREWSGLAVWAEIRACARCLGGGFASRRNAQGSPGARARVVLGQRIDLRKRVLPPSGPDRGALIRLGEHESAPELEIQRGLARMGHAVVGDARHGHAPTNRHFEEKYALDRPFLHCTRLILRHPSTGVPLRIENALPGELMVVLGRMGYLPSKSRND